MSRKINNEDLLDQAWRIAPHTFATKMSEGRWIPFNYLKYISFRIAEAIGKGAARLIIEAPPRHGKSLLSSYWTPPWYLSMYPEKNVILASYGADYADQFGRDVRNLVKVNGELLNFNLREDSKAANRWNTDAGGGMITAGAGGALTGRGGDLIIIDDLVKNYQEAMSATFRQRNIDWYNSVLHTRLEPGGSVILLMTRWHKRDLAGYLIEEHPDDWTEIRLPALAEENDLIGREVGQALNPDRYPVEELHKFKQAMGPTMFNALYQQRPSAEEGGQVKRRYINFYRSLPSKFERVIQSWDMAFKETKNSSFVVGQKWGKIGADCYLLDQVRDRMDFNASLRAVESFSAKAPFCTEKLVEGKANGPAIISMLKNKIMGMVEVEVDGSKEARLAAISPYWEAGNIHLPHPDIAPWVHDFIEEVVNFPAVEHNDQVDAMTQAIWRLRGNVVGEFSTDLIQRKGRTISGGMGTKW